MEEMQTSPVSPHRLRTAVLVNLAAVLERCDEQMLPAVYRFIGASWSATPTQLGYITLSRALVQALSSPLGGIAGYCVHRGRVVGSGCLLWASCTAAFAACNSLAAGVAVWAANGLGLSLVLPSTQSLIADLFEATQRGRAFGMLYCVGALGGMAGALYATNMGAHRPLGLEGWRFAFVSLAVISAATGAANLLLTEGPKRQQQQQQEHPAVALLGEGEGTLTTAEPEGLEAAEAGEGGGEQGVAGMPLSADSALPVLHSSYEDSAVVADEGDRERQPLCSNSSRMDSGGGSSGGGGGNGGGSMVQPAAEALGQKPATAVRVPAGQHEAPRLHVPEKPQHQSLRQQARVIAREVASVLRIPTFLLIVMQGIAGSIPWSALVFLTLYLQLLGMSDAQASSLVALFLAGTAVGGLIGGCVGDFAAKHWPNHGRIVVTQFSVSIGIPLACLVFKGLPRDGHPITVALYAAVLLIFALLKAWPAPACNNPVFAEIVPPEQRNLVYSFDRCFEGAIAACAAPLVGLLAERLFGFSGSGTVSHDQEKDLANAAALGNALLAFLVVPWCFTLCLYSGLHWTYPADKAAALRRQRNALRAKSRALEERGAVLIDRLSSSLSVSSNNTSFTAVELCSHPSAPELAEEPAAPNGGERAALLARGSSSVATTSSSAV